MTPANPIPEPTTTFRRIARPIHVGRLFGAGILAACILLIWVVVVHHGNHMTRDDVKLLVAGAGLGVATVFITSKDAASPAPPASTDKGFSRDHEGVSPVIGVILMVAITVVLAAVVFLLVSNLSHTATQAPLVSMQQDAPQHTLTVLSADAPADWSQVQANITPASCTYKLNTGTATNARAPITTSTTPITAGDVLTIAGGGSTSCKLTLSYIPQNQLIGAWTFPF